MPRSSNVGNFKTVPNFVVSKDVNWTKKSSIMRWFIPKKLTRRFIDFSKKKKNVRTKLRFKKHTCTSILGNLLFYACSLRSCIKIRKISEHAQILVFTSLVFAF